MDAPRLIDGMARFGESVSALVASLSREDFQWKPPDGAWSILEILCHLADEEVEDFRCRLELALRDPSLDWPSIDPPHAAVERRYNEHDPTETVMRFVRERQRSVTWLRSLNTPDWNATKKHPRLGSMRAGDLLVSWAAHDALHLRQIAKRLFQLALRNGAGYSSSYAGEW
ncbi:MAG TPA: DinB family protein [Phycisphaerales bacterium]|nr:DinB family protein [Phycisphaerales bacterium]HRQ75490.1 DinB family protein [Phycisphaerales bacterium]